MFRMNGTHSLSGEYYGFSNWLNSFLAKIPSVIPKRSCGVKGK